ncbi:MAG: type II toxin-antitoxin system RelE/ParE family toxin [Arenimonas sp.]|nr:type II toxin-antitoxin system RelE/ParE family toxin [Arenimonas sp.]MBP6626020.1 type II toxin-antitoxin system RelE/ParE family toxin [Arenimonas sp.]
MSFRIGFTEEAWDDLDRLYGFLLDQSGGDWRQAGAALEAVRRGLALLETSPFACRRAQGGEALMRELLIGFGATGYVALFSIEGADTVLVLALRHQREHDYR